ncbi:MAG: hypothetical protein M2R45_01582 [Verrucomicrobia subdivision 3 bacterium]|nr:hypothetical protein [Limisphaerales bacterium]MCS1412735.1 hypothetical protein [Limisphaerales bacterium]
MTLESPTASYSFSMRNSLIASHRRSCFHPDRITASRNLTPYHWETVRHEKAAPEDGLIRL